MSSELQKKYGFGHDRIGNWMKWGMDLEGKWTNPFALTPAFQNPEAAAEGASILPIEIEYSITPYDLKKFEYPDSIEDHDLYVFSGSEASVLDDDLWIRKAEEFIREIDLKNQTSGKQGKAPPKMMSICFGHQLTHKALGGEVTRNAKHEQAIGTHTYQLNAKLPFMALADYFSSVHDNQMITLDVLHNDQVTASAPGFITVGSSDWTPFGITAKGDYILTFQPHPEYPNKDPENRYVKSLLSFAESASWVDSAQAERMLRQIEGAKFPESHRAAAWLAQFAFDPLDEVTLTLDSGEEKTVVIGRPAPSGVGYILGRWRESLMGAVSRMVAPLNVSNSVEL